MVVSSLVEVDYVGLVSQTNHDQIIELIKADVVIESYDVTCDLENIQNLVKAYGGEVRSISQNLVWSTKSWMESIRDKQKEKVGD